MGRHLCALVCVLATGCSFTFVVEPDDAMLTHKAPVTCTTSRVLPVTDLVIGTVLAGLVFGATHAAVDSFNDECSPGGCYTPWKPALLAAFLVTSPWFISSAVGFSDTQRCRKAAVSAATAPRPPAANTRSLVPVNQSAGGLVRD